MQPRQSHAFPVICLTVQTQTGAMHLLQRSLLTARAILYREVAQSLFERLRSPRRLALAELQLQITSLVLDTDSMRLNELASRVEHILQKPQIR